MSVNRAGADWLNIRKWVMAQVIEVQALLEDVELDFEKTQFARGQMASLRALLRFVEPDHKPNIGDENYG